MITDAKARKFDVIFVKWFSRFARDRFYSRLYKRLLKELGIKVLSLMEPVDPDSPSGFLMEGVSELFDEYYSVSLSVKMIQKRESRARKGLWNGNLPFGYVKGEDGIPAVVSDEADIISQVFDMYASGRWTYQSIATWLNQTKYRPRVHRRDRRERQYLWSKDTVKDMLRNPFYLGHVTYKGKPLPGKHQAIIRQGVFDSIQEVRKLHYKGTSTFTQRHRTYLLAGIVRCVHCGEKLWAQHINGSDYYREESSLRGIPCPNPRKYVKADVLDGQVSELVGSLRLASSWRDLVVRYLNSGEELEKAVKERARLEEKLRRLKKLYREVEITEDDYGREKGLTEAALVAIKYPEQQRVIELGDHVEGMVHAWGQAMKEERRDMLRVMLDAVYVDMTACKIVGIKPKPSFLPLFNLQEPLTADGRILVTGDPDGGRGSAFKLLTPLLIRDAEERFQLSPRLNCNDLLVL
jgi:site-specific DNA recombinase